ncbi:MAG TPA: ABC transporter ATP-binding protein [Pseudonocardiaceae bacterium]|nr:ABC transporter ATP-binding protein [Pseudonocardiaceae bacterium]
MTEQHSMSEGLVIEGLTAGYNRVDVLRGCGLTVGYGQAVSLVGPNGAGKSTLFRVIGGLLSVRSGSLRLDGEDISGGGPNKRARKGIVHVPEGKCVFGNLDVAENLDLGAIALGYDVRQQDLDHVFELFPVLKVKRRQAAGTLSGGEQRMLAIARGLIGRPKFLLLDEPSLGLAPLLVQQLGDACRTLREEGLSIILAEQNLGLVERIGGTAHLMTWGRIDRGTPAASIRSDEQMAKAVLGAELMES